MTSISTEVRKLSHKCFRALLKKFRRKKKRQQIAAAREQQEVIEQAKKENSPNYKEREEERRRNAELWEQFQERERLRKHKLWLLREEQAQLEFQKRKELEEQARIKREDERKRMLAELEEKNFIQFKAEEENKKQKLEKEEALKSALSGLPEGNEPWHNPIAPENYSVQTEKEQCLFFAKTGCCRFGERCSRGHFYPSVSTTILIKGMYSHFSIGQSSCDDYDTDMGLEFEEKETYQHFRSFYEDVLPEFKRLGRVVQFKVCCNHEPHLRGNVYVQYSSEKEAMNAYRTFNGRYYAGKQLTCEYTNVIKWRSAICGLFDSKRCPKGNNCNFLHVFKNPGNEFWTADRDYSSQRHNENYNSSRSRHSPHYYRTYSSRERRHRECSPESYYSSSSRSRKRHYSSESDSSDQDSHYETSSHHKKQKKQHKKKKHRSKSRSRSKTPALSSNNEASYDKNHNHKKRKSKKSKGKRRSSGSGSESD